MSVESGSDRAIERREKIFFFNGKLSNQLSNRSLGTAGGRLDSNASQ